MEDFVACIPSDQERLAAHLALSSVTQLRACLRRVTESVMDYSAVTAYFGPNILNKLKLNLRNDIDRTIYCTFFQEVQGLIWIFPEETERKHWEIEMEGRIHHGAN